MTIASEADLPRPVDTLQGVPDHIRSLLTRLHAASTTQEAALTPADFKDDGSFAHLMQDKFIALEEDKCHFVYQLCRAIGAKTVVEAGTSYGVSTIYLALAVAANVTAANTPGGGRVIATEHEPAKAAKAREYWRECGDEVARVIELREGDLRETLKEDLEGVDFLLLDIWAPMAFPTLKVVQPKLRHGAVVVIDNTTGAATRYRELLDHMRHPGSGFVNSTLPFHNGLELSVYLPQK